MNKNPYQIKDLALELTVQTGEVVSAEVTDYWTDYLHFPGGGRLSISNGGIRLHIFAARPTDADKVSISNAPEIHATASRPAAAIATDIRRRLLPEARQHWQKCREEAARILTRQQTVKAVTEALAPYLSARLESDGTGADVYNNKARAHVYGDGEISRFEISHLTLDQALQILVILEVKQ